MDTHPRILRKAILYTLISCRYAIKASNSHPHLTRNVPMDIYKPILCVSTLMRTNYGVDVHASVLGVAARSPKRKCVISDVKRRLCTCLATSAGVNTPPLDPYAGWKKGATFDEVYDVKIANAGDSCPAMQTLFAH